MCAIEGLHSPCFVVSVLIDFTCLDHCDPQVSAEQSPQDLPEDVLDRDFKSFQVGVTGNTVRQLVLLEAFSVPWSVRILKWNPLFRALKGFQKSILVHLGGVLIEVRSQVLHC